MCLFLYAFIWYGSDNRGLCAVFGAGWVLMIKESLHMLLAAFALGVMDLGGVVCTYIHSSKDLFGFYETLQETAIVDCQEFTVEV